MSKAVMISIHPKWCELIASGKKTVEIRKTRPKIDTPFKCYIYETKGKIPVSETLDKWVGGKVIGEFVCDWCEYLDVDSVGAGFRHGIDSVDGRLMLARSCITRKELTIYNNGKRVYCWHISDLKMYDKPKELSEFGLTKPMQSWGYVEEDYSEEIARDNCEFTMNEFMQNELIRDEGYEYLYGCGKDGQQC